MKTRYKFTLMTLGMVAMVALVTTLTVALVSANPSSVIDFEGLAEGAIVSSVACSSGITCDADPGGSVSVFGTNPDLAGNQAMIFDATCAGGCSGGSPLCVD